MPSAGSSDKLASSFGHASSKRPFCMSARASAKAASAATGSRPCANASEALETAMATTAAEKKRAAVGANVIVGLRSIAQDRGQREKESQTSSQRASRSAERRTQTRTRTRTQTQTRTRTQTQTRTRTRKRTQTRTRTQQTRKSAPESPHRRSEPAPRESPNPARSSAPQTPRRPRIARTTTTVPAFRSELVSRPRRSALGWVVPPVGTGAVSASAVSAYGSAPEGRSLATTLVGAEISSRREIAMSAVCRSSAPSPAFARASATSRMSSTALDGRISGRVESARRITVASDADTSAPTSRGLTGLRRSATFFSEPHGRRPTSIV